MRLKLHFFSAFYNIFRLNFKRLLSHHCTASSICCWQPCSPGHHDKIFFLFCLLTKQSFTTVRLFCRLVTSIEANKMFLTLFLVFDKVILNVNNNVAFKIEGTDLNGLHASCWLFFICLTSLFQYKYVISL